MSKGQLNDAERAQLARDLALGDEAVADSLAETAGGNRPLLELAQWARANLSAADHQAFQRELKKPDRAESAIRQVMRLRAEADERAGLDSVRAAGGFTSYEDMTKSSQASMHSDRARREHERRLAATPASILGAIGSGAL